MNSITVETLLKERAEEKKKYREYKIMMEEAAKKKRALTTQQLNEANNRWINESRKRSLLLEKHDSLKGYLKDAALRSNKLREIEIAYDSNTTDEEVLEKIGNILGPQDT